MMKKLILLLIILLAVSSVSAMVEYFLIEDGVGEFEFINPDTSLYCDIVHKGDCIVYFANYRPLFDGVDSITVGVETHTVSFSNSEAVEGIVSEFGSGSNTQVEEEVWKGNNYYVFLRGDSPYDVGVVWYSGTNVVAIIIENWEDYTVDDGIFEPLLDAYFAKYPSDLVFEPEEEPVQNFLIEDGVGEFEFISSDIDDGCDIVSKGECNIYIGFYGPLFDGMDEVVVGVETHTVTFSNSEAVEGIVSEFGSGSDIDIEEEVWRGNNYYVFIRGDNPYDVAVVWYRGTNVIAIIIENWNEDQVDDDLFEPLLDAYFAKYPSDLVFELEELPIPEEIVCTDSDGGSNIYVASEAQSSDGRGAFDYCSFLEEEKGVLYEAICEGSLATHVAVKCPSEATYCNRAVCSSEPPKCEDTDGGNIPSIRGTITEPRNEDGPTHTDYCENLGTKQPWNNCDGKLCGLREYYCLSPYRTTTYQDVKCSAGCKDGVCTEDPVEEPVEEAFIIKGRLVEKYSRKPLVNVLVTHVDSKDGWHVLGEEYTDSNGGFEFEDSTYEAGYILNFAPDCFSQAGIVGERNPSTGGYEFYLYDTSEYCNERNYPIAGGVVDLGEVGLQPAADIELYLDTPASFNVYQRSKYCNYDIGGAGNGNKLREHSLSNIVLLGYENMVILNERGSDVIESDFYEVPYKEGCYKIKVYYANGKFEWGDLVEKKVSGHCYNGVQDGDEDGVDCGRSCEESCEKEICNKNGVCDMIYDEDSDNCPEDCSCGDWICDPAENSVTCSEDCEKCEPEWKCVLKPTICPPEGMQSKICYDVRCGTEDRREEVVKCTPSTCEGCLAEGICYPVMSKMLLDETPSYCDFTKNFAKQKYLGEPCRNDYECRSDECSNGECISLKKELEETRSLLEKILKWLGDWF